MRVKTSVTLSEDIVKTIDRLGGNRESRSQTIERLIRESLATRARQSAADRDRERIDRNSDSLNAEVQDALRYQADV
jgi:metal-responsive CopG/Arc/MetJ family transcriptional regulator